MTATLTVRQSPFRDPSIIDVQTLDLLISALAASGYQVIGPRKQDEAIVYDTLRSAADLPVGYADDQDGGRYRLVKGRDGVYFDHVVGPHSWKRFLFPPHQKICQMRKQGKAFRIVEEAAETPRYAFLGVRACEIAAMRVQDRVFDNGTFADPGYLARRNAAFIVAVNCGRSGGTCFCASMGTGPQVKGGFDLALTELVDKKSHVFLVEVGSPRGAEILAKLPHRAAGDGDTASAQAVVAKVAKGMGRAMVADVAPLLKRNLEHARWNEVAKRCLSCANCTMVCPTCFCSTVEDVTDLTGSNAERWRRWDSCFTMDFSYIHGGAVRRETASRYRQWMTHKLSSWFEQFETSGCVGCGRCITWCPAAIDITEEARAIKESEGRR